MSSTEKLDKADQSTKASIAPVRTGPIVSGGTVFRLLFFTFLMVTLPISSYFASKRWVFEGYMNIAEENSAVPSALTAVVMVHIVLGLFIYAAYTEDIPTKEKQA